MPGSCSKMMNMKPRARATLAGMGWSSTSDGPKRGDAVVAGPGIVSDWPRYNWLGFSRRFDRAISGQRFESCSRRCAMPDSVSRGWTR
jgi:hypothetical protein